MRNAYSHRQNMLVFAWHGKHYFVILFIAVYIMRVWKLYLKNHFRKSSAFFARFMFLSLSLVFKALGLVNQMIISKRAGFKGMINIIFLP